MLVLSPSKVKTRRKKKKKEGMYIVLTLKPIHVRFLDAVAGVCCWSSTGPDSYAALRLPLGSVGFKTILSNDNFEEDASVASINRTEGFVAVIEEATLCSLSVSNNGAVRSNLNSKVSGVTTETPALTGLGVAGCAITAGIVVSPDGRTLLGLANSVSFLKGVAIARGLDGVDGIVSFRISRGGDDCFIADFTAADLEMPC